MKRIIDGKRYDTSTAEEIATATHGYKSEFSYYEETLYCKRTGEYFLYGYGHGESKYAKQVLGDWGPGEDIIPMTYEQARQWAEVSLDVEEYEREFGPTSEDGDGADVVLSVRVSPSTREILRRLSKQTGRSQGDLLDEIVARAEIEF